MPRCVGSGVRGEVSVSGEYLGLQSVTREETSAAGTSHSDTDSVMCLTGVSSCVFLAQKEHEMAKEPFRRLRNPYKDLGNL